MKIQLKRSNQLDGGSAKEPTAAQMEYGELAVNYNSDDPVIFIKDSDDSIIRIAGGNALGNIEIPSEGDDPHQDGTLDDRYVELTGDNMTGDLTLGTDKIVLDATDGSAEFANQVEVLNGGYKFPDGTVQTTAYSPGDSDNDYVNVTGDNMTGDLTLGTDKILLNATDGSATFASGVDSGLYFRVESTDDNYSPFRAKNEAGEEIFVVDGLGSASFLNATQGAYTFISNRPAANSFCISGGTTNDPGNIEWSILPNGDANFNGVTFGADCVIEPGSLNVYQAANSNSTSVFNGGWNTGGGRNITSSIFSDGSAEFAGDVTVGDFNSSSEEGNGVILGSDGGVYSQLPNTDPGTGVVFQGMKGIGYTSRITAGGSAEFAGDITAGDVSETTGGSQIQAVGSVVLRNDGNYTPDTFVVYNGGLSGSNQTILMQNDGSATFDGTVTTTKNDLGFFANSALVNRGTSFRSIDNNTGSSTHHHFHGSDADGNGNIFLNTDGSAEFDGAITGKSTIESENTYYNPAFRVTDRTTTKYTSWISGNGGLFLGTDLVSDAGGSTLPVTGSSIFLNGLDGSATFEGDGIYRGTLSITGSGSTNGLYVGDGGEAVIKKDGSAAFGESSTLTNEYVKLIQNNRIVDAYQPGLTGDFFAGASKNADGTVTEKLSIAADGSAEFVEGKARITESGGYVMESSSGALSQMNGDGIYQTDGSDTTITMLSDGSATFAGLVQSGGNPISGAEEGAQMNGGSGFTAAYSSDSSLLWKGYKIGNSTPTSSIAVDGSATFDGTVQIGGESYGNAPGLIADPSGYFRVTATGANDVWRSYQDGSNTVTSAITAGGAASFAGEVECTSAGDGIILASPNGTRYRITVADDGTINSSAV